MVTSPSFVDGYLRSRAPLRIAVRKEVEISSETSISACKATLYHNSEDHNVDNHMVTNFVEVMCKLYGLLAKSAFKWRRS
jgi:hypothetical protein